MIEETLKTGCQKGVVRVGTNDFEIRNELRKGLVVWWIGRVPERMTQKNRPMSVVLAWA